MIERSIQLLACEFHVSADAEAVIRWLDGVRPSAVQDHPVLHRHRLDVRREDGGYRVREDGEDRGVSPGPEAAGAVVEQRLHELAFGALGDSTKVHAGCGTWKDRRFLIVGNGRAGKTTLMTRLLFEGFAVEGDEMIVIRDGGVVAYPRRFGIRRPTLSLVPQVGALVPDLAGAGEPDPSGGYQVLAFDPSQLGLPWRIGSGAVDVLFLLDGRAEGPTLAHPCPKHAMVQRVMAQSHAPAAGRAVWVRDICALVNGAAGYLLTLGDLDSAVATVRSALEASAAQAQPSNLEDRHGRRQD
ncbi:MAG TPA: hypothetical protein VMS64_32995 [Candidatus Methylomirabilis sp.]|nr:hypothetical protein [Candidatus Methylomirabilis sp.]